MRWELVAGWLRSEQEGRGTRARHATQLQERVLARGLAEEHLSVWSAQPEAGAAWDKLSAELEDATATDPLAAAGVEEERAPVAAAAAAAAPTPLAVAAEEARKAPAAAQVAVQEQQGLPVEEGAVGGSIHVPPPGGGGLAPADDAPSSHAGPPTPALPQHATLQLTTTAPRAALQVRRNAKGVRKRWTVVSRAKKHTLSPSCPPH